MRRVCVSCYLCKVRKISKSKSWTRYASHFCSLAFHIRCYAAYLYGLEIKRHDSKVHADVWHIPQGTRMVTSQSCLRHKLTSYAVPMSDVFLSISRDTPQTPVSSTQSAPPETLRKRRRVETEARNTGRMCKDSETHIMGSATHDDGIAEVANNRALGEVDKSIEALLS